MAESLKVATKLSIGQTTELTIWQAMDMINGMDDPTIVKWGDSYAGNLVAIKMLAKRTYGTIKFFQSNLLSAFSPMWVSNMSALSDLVNSLMSIYSNKKLLDIYDFWLIDKQGVSDTEVDIMKINFPNYFKEPLESVQQIVTAEQERASHLEGLPLDEIIQYVKKMRGSISVLSILAEDLSNRSSAVVDFVNQFIWCIYDTLPDEKKPDMTKLLSSTNSYTSAVMTRLECFIPVKEEGKDK